MWNFLKNISFYYALILALLIPIAVFACDCDPDASPWYKHLPNQTLGYIAQEFDKSAPTPGMNWNGDADDWFSNAAQFGWVEKTAPQDAQVGALILWKNTNEEVSVGIVRQVATDHILYETSNKDGSLIQSSIDFTALSNQLHLIGYIYPAKVDRAKQKRLLLN
jgi:hypothetical protein